MDYDDLEKQLAAAGLEQTLVGTKTSRKAKSRLPNVEAIEAEAEKRFEAGDSEQLDSSNAHAESCGSNLPVGL